MNWQTVYTSVILSLFSSGMLTAGIIYVLKKGFDQIVDLKYEKLLETSKLEIQEEIRRKTELYNKQSEIFQRLLSLVYRLRNISRDLLSEQLGNEETKDAFEEHFDYFKELQEMIYNNRAILPDSVFRIVHEVKNRALQLHNDYQTYLNREKKETSEHEFKLKVRHVAQVLDEKYTLLVDLIQPRLGVSSPK